MEGSYPQGNRPEVSPLDRIVRETPEIKSFYVDIPRIARSSEPGQFLMVWVIGVDEIPMAVSAARDDGILGVTVEKVGDATSRLHELGEGDLVGFRGPYGNGFDLSGDKLLMVCGGCGAAPLALAAEEALSEGREVKVVLTAGTEEALLFRSRLEKLDLDLLIGTEDGSAGVEGLTTDVLEEIDPDEDFDSCLICGPERMMVASAELVEGRGIPVQVSLERYMKCGVGICGQCSLDPSGLRVCEEGPVFRYREVKGGEFGEYMRDSTGRRIEI